MILQGKIALVTGAARKRGIGRAIALRLAREGADVAVTDIQPCARFLPPEEVETGWQGLESVVSEIEAIGRRGLLLNCDLTVEAQVQGLVQEVVARLGGIDILVNNARALERRRVPVVELEASEWDQVMGVNIRGVFLCAKYAARQMIQQKRGGRIVNISSIAGRQGRSRAAAYSSSKFAIIGFTQSLARELAPYGITVNTICPGSVSTDRLHLDEREQAEKEGISAWEYRQRQFAQAAQRIPMGRVATPEEIAAAVFYLASPDADCIVGQAIDVNGGEFMA